MTVVTAVRVGCFAALCLFQLPVEGRAQVVVRHSVVAEVAPVVVVRDSAWSTTRAVGGATTTTWSGEVTANTSSEIQVMVPRDAARPTFARIDAGLWVRLDPGAWQTVIVAPAGRRVVTMELLVTPSDTLRLMPAVRVINR